MRYIDADKIDFSPLKDDFDRARAKVIIMGQPTADVVEVKHSRWEKISGFYVCNICGTSPAYWEPEPNNPKGYPPYCHHCGAKMDGGNAE